MRKKGKLKTLILSISVLILLIMIYIYTGSGNGSSNSPESKPVETVSVFKKIESFTSDTISKLQEKHEIRRAEKEAKKQAEMLLLGEKDTQEDIVAASVEKENQEEQAELSEEEKEALQSANYVAPYEIKIPDDMKIPSKTGNFEFRNMADYVYAYDNVKLYTKPDCDGEEEREADIWEEFLRTGISEECVYQLVSSNGELLYADGTHFRRHREDMPLTETVLLPQEKVELEVEYISQFPTLTNGPEVTSLATVLKYYSYDITKDDLNEYYLPKGKAGHTNFYDAYIGEPSSRNNSYGCYSGAIVTAANTYLEEKESSLRAVDYTGLSFTEVLKLVKEGKPVIVWITRDENVEPIFTADWIVDGEYIIWKDNMHCVVITGYDLNSNEVIVSDPMYGIKEYDMAGFIKRFKKFYSQAVALEPLPEETP